MDTPLIEYIKNNNTDLSLKIEFSVINPEHACFRHFTALQCTQNPVFSTKTRHNFTENVPN